METRVKKAALAAIMTAATLGFAPLSAQAGSYGATLTTSCYSGVGTVGIALDGVESAILAGDFLNARDRTSMLGKLSSAASKAGVRKWADANAKLEDITDQANALAGAAKPKLGSAAADAIVAAAYSAQMCMNGL